MFATARSTTAHRTTEKPLHLRNLIICDACSSDVLNLANQSLTPKLYISESNNPVDVITMFLRHNPVDTLHVFAHGKKGAILLGGNWITAEELGENSSLIAQWQVNRIALWPCETGADSEFTGLLAQLTGAEVFSSALPVGNSPGVNNLKVESDTRSLHLDQLIDSEILATSSFLFGDVSIYLPSGYFGTQGNNTNQANNI